VTGASAPIARAQAFAVESINAIATWNDPWEGFFPNEFDPFHPKQLRFEGIATVGGDPTTPLPATLYVQFDWLDPALGVVYTPPWSFPVSYTPTMTPIDVSWTISFCPQQVSLHFATNTPDGGVVNFAGSFTHWCVPEPSSYGMAGALGLLGLAVWRRLARSER
jgi:hypothetical protein